MRPKIKARMDETGEGFFGGEMSPHSPPARWFGNWEHRKLSRTLGQSRENQEGFRQFWQSWWLAHFKSVFCCARTISVPVFIGIEDTFA